MNPCHANCSSPASCSTSATTSAGRSWRRPSGSRTRAGAIIKLNIGNPAPFGFEAPDEILVDVIHNLPKAQGYSDSRGLFSARTAIVQHYQSRGIDIVDVDDVWLGNGVSELITISLQALLDNGDEVLVPTPDYPLWTAATSLAGGRPVHYRCDEANGWQPDLDDLRAKVTDRTKAIVVINPNNPTGAVYGEQVLEASPRSRGEHELVVLADEIYDKILYDDAVHVPFAAVAPDLFTLTFNGLSKAYRVAGFRSGWLMVTGPKRHARSYLEGIAILANMRLCANVPAQHAVQIALGGKQSIRDLVLPGGRLRRAARRRDEGARRHPRRDLRASPRARCTCSLGSIRSATRSPTTSASCSNCCARSTSWWCRGRDSTGRPRTTCASSRCRAPTT